MDTLLWYWAVSWDYVAQMLPCMLLAALVFFLLRPWRKKRLARQGMASAASRSPPLAMPCRAKRFFRQGRRRKNTRAASSMQGSIWAT